MSRGFLVAWTVLAIGMVAGAEDTALCRPGKGQAWGYLGDGSGVMEAKPPLKFDAKNVAWKTPLPSWGSASPIVVKDRVFVVCEPRRDQPWPELICLSLADGKERWRVALDHLPVCGLDAAKQKQAQHLWAEFWRKFFLFLDAKHQAAADPSRKPALVEELKSKGLVLKQDLEIPDGTDLSALSNKHSPLKQSALSMDTWALWGKIGAYMIGEAFATPITDGDHVYAVTAWGGFFCFDLDGKAKWVKHYPGVPGEYCRNGRSPIIWKDLLLSDITATMRAIDRATGELKWSAPNDGGAYLTPAVIRCGTTDIVLCGKAEAFRLPDGRKLTVEGVPAFGCVAITKPDEPSVAFFQGGDEHGGWARDQRSPMAARFQLDGETLRGTILWQGVGEKSCPSQFGLAYHRGRVYSQDAVLDAATGKVIQPRGPKGTYLQNTVPGTQHLLLIADGHIFGYWANRRNRPKEESNTVFVNVSTLDGRPLPSSSLPGYNYSSSFAISGDSLFLRNSDHLVRIRSSAERAGG